MLDKLKQIPELIALLICAAGGLIFFMMTDPGRLAPIMLMVGYALIAGVLYSAVRLTGRLSGLQGRFGGERYKLFLIAATALPLILLAMQSLGQLTIRDTVTIVILFAAGWLYISRTAA